jgi:hypothetical protein
LFVPPSAQRSTILARIARYCAPVPWRAWDIGSAGPAQLSAGR